MIPLNISSQANTGFTLLSNTFIDNYLDDANDAQIKVYLYLLRTLSDNISTDISEIADKFNYTEKDIIKSIKHWEGKGILSVIYNRNNDITGIVFNSLESSENISIPKYTNNINELSYSQNNDNETINTVSDEPCNNKSDMHYNMPMNTSVEEPNDEAKQINSQFIDAPFFQDKDDDSVSMIKMDYEKEKASYSAEQIDELKKDSNIILLLNTVPMYFGRLLTPTDIRSLLFIYDRLGFSYEMLDCMIEQSAEIEKKSMHFIEHIAIQMYEQGITTVERAKKFIKESSKNVNLVMRYLGKSGLPTDIESKCINKWLYSYGFSLQIIKAACDKAVKYTDKNRMSYADKILADWYSKNVCILSDVEKLDEEFDRIQKERAQKAKLEKSQKTARPTAKANSFLNMQTHNYDLREIEKQILSN